MNYWTPERCKTIPTMVLMDNSLEISAQGAVSKNPSIRKRNAEIVEMIQAELLPASDQPAPSGAFLVPSGNLGVKLSDAPYGLA